MLSLTAPSRREWLRIGGLAAVDASLTDVLNARAKPPIRPPRLASDVCSTSGKAKNVIYLWLQGGQPQHETFDPKPDAPVDIRGLFKPIATNVPGIRFCELLPRTARYADKLAVVRSLSTRDDNAQEIRNARGGQFTFTIKAEGEGSLADEFDKTFFSNFTCRLILFRFRDTNKDPREVEKLAAVEWGPCSEKTESFKVARFLGSTVAGANFSIGNGLGVAVQIVKKTAGTLTLAKNESHRAAIRIHFVTLEFNPRRRDESVTEYRRAFKR